jgi:hypothetical protein
MRAVTGALSFIVICLASTPSAALTRRSSDHPFFARTAVSGYFGAGVAVGEFASDKDGDGNEESGAFDWSAEIEHFFSPGVSVGFNITHTSYADKDFGDDLKTNLSTFGGFLRYVIDTRGPAYPYMRLGFGSMEVEFETPDARDEADHAGSIHVGGGGIFMLGDYASLNASVLYTFGFTDDVAVGDIIVIDDEEVVQVVGFDVQYWTFAAGVSFYFP